MGPVEPRQARAGRARPPKWTTTPRGTCGVGSPAPGGGPPCVPCSAPRREGGSVPRGVGAGSGGSGTGGALGSSQPWTEGTGRRRRVVLDAPLKPEFQFTYTDRDAKPP
ncbi:unnamed protein product [Coccothraustes coccothraustes]